MACEIVNFGLVNKVAGVFLPLDVLVLDSELDLELINLELEPAVVPDYVINVHLRLHLALGVVEHLDLPERMPAPAAAAESKQPTPDNVNVNLVSQRERDRLAALFGLCAREDLQVRLGLELEHVLDRRVLLREGQVAAHHEGKGLHQRPLHSAQDPNEVHELNHYSLVNHLLHIQPEVHFSQD